MSDQGILPRPPTAVKIASAEAWLGRLLVGIGLTFSDILVRAGNHGVDRT